MKLSPRTKRILAILLGPALGAYAATLIECIVVIAITFLVVAGATVIVVKAIRACHKIGERKAQEIINQLGEDIQNSGSVTNGTNVIKPVHVTWLVGTNSEMANARLLMSPNPTGTNWTTILAAIVDNAGTNFITTQSCGFFRLELSK